MQKVIVTGGAGFIGSHLVDKLIKKGIEVIIIDNLSTGKKENLNPKAFHVNIDLSTMNIKKLHWQLFPMKLFKNVDIVFHLAGIKGSPQRCMEEPASFSVPMIQFNANMIEAAHNAGVEWFLYTSSVGVYHPSEVFE